MAVVVRGVAYSIFHVPDLVQYGSKPWRDIENQIEQLGEIRKNLRTYDDVVRYAPNQVFIGNMCPDDLHQVPRAWFKNLLTSAEKKGPFGEIMPEDEFYAWMKLADDFNLLWLDPSFTAQITDKWKSQPSAKRDSYALKLGEGTPREKIQEIIEKGIALPVYFEGKLVGSLRQDHDQDDTLKSEVLMENLVAKASGAFTVIDLLKKLRFDPTDVDFVLDCTETAVGDRYNRGGGGLAKAMAELAGCVNATGNDVRAFCCAPNHAIVNACGLVESGIFRNVVVAGGGCLAKLGMKFSAHLKHQMPILEDVVAGIALLITKDDGQSPVIRLDSIGKHNVGAGSPQQAIMTSLILKPLNKLGLKMMDVDKYSTELHNPEITLPAGSGDTPLTNYKIMAALAVLNKEIEKSDMDQFVRERGMPGYSPTQGHIPSSVPFLGHALEAMRKGHIERAMFVAKGSFFLGRMTQLSDGISFLLEANHRK